MVAGKSPEWLPSGFTEKIRYKDGRKIKYYVNDATGAKYHSKKDVISSATTEIVSNVLLQITNDAHTTNDDDHGLSSNTKVDDISAKPKTNDTLHELPAGWTVEEKTKNLASGKGSKYKVYIESSSGSKFYSKAAVARYLNSRDHANTTTLQNKLDIVTLPEVPQTNVPQTNADCTPEKEKKESSSNMVATMSSPADGLPPGWIKETRTCRSGDKTRQYPVYIDSSSGNKFSSKAAVARYLNNVEHANTTPVQNKVDNVDEPIPDISPPMTNVGPTPEKKRKERSLKKVATLSTSADGLPPGWIKEIKITNSGNKRRKVAVYINTSSGTRLFSRVAVDRYVNSADHANTTAVQNKLDNVNEPSLNMSQQLPMTNASPATEKKMKESSYKLVATVSSPAEGLPPGWIKEIRTSQYGDKIRKEPYYTDPVSGYEFRSKPDVLRYLKNGDIRYCVVRPKRKEFNGPKVTQNEVPMSEQANPDFQELTSKSTYWQNQAHSFEERAKALEVQQANYDDNLKKAKEKEARLVVTLEASLSREEQKSSQLDASQKELKVIKMALDDKTGQLETAQKELAEKTSQLEAAQKELEEKSKENLDLREELSREKEKVVGLERANCPTPLVGMGGAPKGFDINRFDPFRVDGSGNAFTTKGTTSTTTTSVAAAVPNPQVDEFASLFGDDDDDRGQGQGQPRWPRYF